MTGQPALILPGGETITSVTVGVFCHGRIVMMPKLIFSVVIKMSLRGV
jgi:hypothetical protein